MLELERFIGGMTERNPESILALEDALNDVPAELHQEIPVEHHFHDGMYIREIVIPAGTILTGRIHKYDHFDIMLSGDITVSTNDGVRRMEGFHILNGNRGKKRAGYAHSDTHWITVHRSPLMKGEKMFDYLTVGTFQEMDSFLLEYNQSCPARKAFEKQTSYRDADYKAFKLGYLAAKNGK